MKRKKFQLAVFLAAFVVTLAATAPASLLGAWLAHATDRRLELAEPAGSLWNGRAIPVLKLDQGVPLRLGSMEWEVSIGRLWRGQLLLRLRDVEAPQDAPMEIYLGLRQVELRNVALDLPAAAMGGLNPLLQAMRFQGRLAVSANSVVLTRRGEITGTAAVNWGAAGSALSAINPFGNYRFDLAGTGDKVRIVMGTLSGDLQLSGQGDWHAGVLSFQATASATGARKDAFSEILHHLGPETSPGVFSFKVGQ